MNSGRQGNSYIVFIIKEKQKRSREHERKSPIFSPFFYQFQAEKKLEVGSVTSLLLFCVFTETLLLLFLYNTAISFCFFFFSKKGETKKSGQARTFLYLYNAGKTLMMEHGKRGISWSVKWNANLFYRVLEEPHGAIRQFEYETFWWLVPGFSVQRQPSRSPPPLHITFSLVDCWWRMVRPSSRTFEHYKSWREKKKTKKKIVKLTSFSLILQLL